MSARTVCKIASYFYLDDYQNLKYALLFALPNEKAVECETVTL